MFAQGEDSTLVNNYYIRIDSISISGNETTKPEVILRELTFGIGDTVNKKIMEYNKERIYSLQIFTYVEINVKNINSINIASIEVKESWYIYPVPFVELQDQDWKKISYGINLFVRNFRGLNETVQAVASFGYDPKLAFFYNHPYFFVKDKIDFTYSLSYQNAKNKSMIAQGLYGGGFNQKYISTLIDLTKRFDLFNRVDFSFGYNYVESSFYLQGVSASNGRTDRAFFTRITYTYDTRDLAQFPSYGLFATAGFQYKGFGLDGINYQIANLDFREYLTFFSKLRAKWRFASRMTFGGTVPYYDYSYIGYTERIRGNFNLEMEGRNSYIGSFELNYPLVKDIYVELNFVPWIPRELLSYRFAVYLELFTDAGSVTRQGEQINLGDFRSGYGTGLIFLILPYSLLRIEYAFNEYRKSELIASFGVSF